MGAKVQKKYAKRKMIDHFAFCTDVFLLYDDFTSADDVDALRQLRGEDFPSLQVIDVLVV